MWEALHMSWGPDQFGKPMWPLFTRPVPNILNQCSASQICPIEGTWKKNAGSCKGCAAAVLHRGTTNQFVINVFAHALYQRSSLEMPHFNSYVANVRLRIRTHPQGLKGPPSTKKTLMEFEHHAANANLFFNCQLQLEVPIVLRGGGSSSGWSHSWILAFVTNRMTLDDCGPEWLLLLMVAF